MTAHTGGDPDMCPGCRQLPASQVPAILCPGPQETPMIVHLTWQPDDDGGPETIIAEMAAAHVSELQDLLAEGVDFGETAIWIPVPTGDAPGAPFHKRLFRLARITNVTAA